MIKKPPPQNSNKHITFTSCSQKRITKEAKIPSQIFGGLDLVILERFYRTVFVWYAKLTPIKSKCFVEWGCANSHPANLYQIYKSYHVSGNQTQKLSLNTIDFYARAWECEYDKSIFGTDYNNPVTPSSPEITIRSEEAADEMSRTPGTMRENSPEVCPQTGRSCDGTDTDHYMQPDADASIQHPDPPPTNPSSSKYNLRPNPKPNCIDD